MDTKIKDFENDENTTTDSMAFSVHTITLRCPFANMERSLVKDKLCVYCSKYGTRYYREEVGNRVYWNFELRNKLCVNRVIIWDLYSDGIIVRSGLDITLNPRHFYHKDDHPFTYIADQEDLDNITVYLDKMITELELGLEIHMFVVHRIDLCANIKLGSRDEVKTYMRLMKKGAYAYNGKRKMEYSETQRKKVPTKNSFTISGKSFEFTVYDKYMQMSSSDMKYSKEDLEHAATQIRIELRVKRNKWKSMEEKYNIYSLGSIIKKIGEVSRVELVRYITKTYGVGSFVKFNYAKNVINMSSYHNKTKNVMIEFMEKASKENLEAAKDMYYDRYGSIMKKFRELRISPITLPCKSLYLHFYSPITYIAKEI